jgi:hypothetical protein
VALHRSNNPAADHAAAAIAIYDLSRETSAGSDEPPAEDSGTRPAVDLPLSDTVSLHQQRP